LPAIHTPLWQSLATLQLRLSAQAPQLAPPQSTSVSVPFLTRSPQLDVWHVFGLPEQTPLIQSAAPVQVLAVAHFEQVPPQSASLSLPFFMPSLQVAVAHLPALQTPLWQSAPIEQLPASGHWVQFPPPQSISVSVPFSTPSLHPGALHLPALQTPL
jgi:hypothetical protein